MKKGGYCQALREQIDYCLNLEKHASDPHEYRTLQSVVEWMEGFAEEKGFALFRPSEALMEEAKKLLDTTRLDCYEIAERLTRSL